MELISWCNGEHDWPYKDAKNITTCACGEGQLDSGDYCVPSEWLIGVPCAGVGVLVTALLILIIWLAMSRAELSRKIREMEEEAENEEDGSQDGVSDDGTVSSTKTADDRAAVTAERTQPDVVTEMTETTPQKPVVSNGDIRTEIAPSPENRPADERAMYPQRWDTLKEEDEAPESPAKKQERPVSMMSGDYETTPEPAKKPIPVRVSSDDEYDDVYHRKTRDADDDSTYDDIVHKVPSAKGAAAYDNPAYSRGTELLEEAKKFDSNPPKLDFIDLNTDYAIRRPKLVDSSSLQSRSREMVEMSPTKQTMRSSGDYSYHIDTSGRR